MLAWAILLAAALVVAPLGARAADLVVWWDKGYSAREDQAVEEVVAAFEQKAGKDIELVFQPEAEHLGRLRAALDAGHPPDFLFGILLTVHVNEWAHNGQLVDLSDALGPLRDLFDADALDAATLLDATSGRTALFALPVGRSSNHVHVWRSLLEQAGFTLADIPKDWEAFWSFWCDKVQPAVRKATGREDIYGVGLVMAAEAGDTYIQFLQFLYAYGADETRWFAPDGRIVIDDPALRARFIEALEIYTTIYRKGCVPPDAKSWANPDNNKAFLAQRVVMTVNETLSIPNALRTARSEDYYKNSATINWPNGTDGRPLLILGQVYRAAIFKHGEHEMLAKEFVRFLVGEGWLAHYFDFAGERLLPPMPSLLEQPFWLDPTDPHRMVSAMQVLTRRRADSFRLPPREHWGRIHRLFEERILAKAVHRVVAEDVSPEQAADEAIARIKQILSE